MLVEGSAKASRERICELTTKQAGEPTPDILDALLPPPAFIEDEGKALWSLWWSAQRDARCPCEKGLHAAKMVEQARTGEEVEPEGQGGRGSWGWNGKSCGWTGWAGVCHMRGAIDANHGMHAAAG